MHVALIAELPLVDVTHAPSQAAFRCSAGSTCCAKTWSTNASKEVILTAHRRLDQRPRETDCYLREVLLTPARNGYIPDCGGRCNRRHEAGLGIRVGLFYVCITAASYG